jgi:hypothetical protein
MKMAGSISVTRIDELTDNVVDKWRNRFSTEKRTVLLRVALKSESLRYSWKSGSDRCLI